MTPVVSASMFAGKRRPSSTPRVQLPPVDNPLPPPTAPNGLPTAPTAARRRACDVRNPCRRPFALPVPQRPRRGSPGIRKPIREGPPQAHLRRLCACARRARQPTQGRPQAVDAHLHRPSGRSDCPGPPVPARICRQVRGQGQRGADRGPAPGELVHQHRRIAGSAQRVGREGHARRHLRPRLGHGRQHRHPQPQHPAPFDRARRRRHRRFVGHPPHHL